MTSFCGCCGHEMPGSRSDWCRRCEAHVLATGSPERRTYYAQFKQDCPWQIGHDIAAAEGEGGAT